MSLALSVLTVLFVQNNLQLQFMLSVNRSFDSFEIFFIGKLSIQKVTRDAFMQHIAFAVSSCICKVITAVDNGLVWQRCVANNKICIWKDTKIK